MEKISLYKFIHISLLKNDTQLKQKGDKQPKNNPNLSKNKNHVLKKIMAKQKRKKKKKKQTLTG